MGAYAPLHAWLVGQPANVNHILTTFEQIEGILGFPLPPTARRRPQWWENNPNQHSHARAWLDAGFLTEQVNVPNESLTFRRVNSN
jgi:hypothetical protein